MWTTPELAPISSLNFRETRLDNQAEVIDIEKNHRNCRNKNKSPNTFRYGLEERFVFHFPKMLRCGNTVVKVLDHGRHVMSSSPVPLKTRRVGQRCTLNLSKAETSCRWCSVVVRRGGASSGVVHVT
ncbi:uncharacterized protein TNCV_3222841 [Trichonephila clavipes]|nr:uncharacterized protein TNCV_3222841 [Trichonephila clavipes]